MMRVVRMQMQLHTRSPAQNASKKKKKSDWMGPKIAANDSDKTYVRRPTNKM